MNFKKYNQDNINPDYWKFLNENKKQFGVPDDVNYTEDGDPMYKAFGKDISMSFATELEYVPLSDNLDSQSGTASADLQRSKRYGCQHCRSTQLFEHSGLAWTKNVVTNSKATVDTQRQKHWLVQELRQPYVRVT